MRRVETYPMWWAPELGLASLNEIDAKLAAVGGKRAVGHSRSP